MSDIFDIFENIMIFSIPVELYKDSCYVLNVYLLVIHLLMFVVKENDQIRVAVVNGQRPDLSVIAGPEPLKSLVVDWISRCWHQSPDERPTFAGINWTFH